MRRWAWIALVMLLGLALRLLRLGAWDIGLDEAYSARVAAMPLRDLVGFVARDDFHPPLYYLFLHLWRPVAGSSEFWLRFPNGVAVVRYGGRDDLLHVVGVVRQSRRVWLLLKQPDAVDPYGRVRELLRSRKDLVAQAAFPTGIRIEVYGPRGGP